jgi:hypothetical protein
MLERPMQQNIAEYWIVKGMYHDVFVRVAISPARCADNNLTGVQPAWARASRAE